VVASHQHLRSVTDMFKHDGSYEVRGTKQTARYLGTLNNGNEVTALFAVQRYKTGSEEIIYHRALDGAHFQDRNSDIVPRPVRRSKWRNIYLDATRTIQNHDSRETADNIPGSSGRLGVLELRYEDDNLIEGVFHKGAPL